MLTTYVKQEAKVEWFYLGWNTSERPVCYDYKIPGSAKKGSRPYILTIMMTVLCPTNEMSSLNAFPNSILRFFPSGAFQYAREGRKTIVIKTIMRD